MSRRFAFLFVVLALGSSMSCSCEKENDDDPCAPVTSPFDVGSADGHPQPLGATAGQARAGRVLASQLPPTPSNQGLWEQGDFVLANDKVAVVIEDVDDSDLYDPWGGRPIGFARMRDGQMVDASDFGELLLFAMGPSTVVTEHVGVISDGSDGGPAIVRAEGRLSPVPFVYGLIRAVLGSESYREKVTRVAIDYVLEPGSEHVDIGIRVKHTSPNPFRHRGNTGIGYMYSYRLKNFAPGAGFDTYSDSATRVVGLVSETGVGYAFEAFTDRDFASVPTISGFSASLWPAPLYQGCSESPDEAVRYGRLHVGGPDADALMDVVARSRSEATRAISGRVVDANGQGRANARVHVVRSGGVDYYITRTRTDAQGNYTVHVPSDEAVDLYAFVDGEAFVGPVASANGSSAADLVLPGTATLKVAAAVDGSGAPIPYKIQVVPADQATTIPQPPNDRFGEHLTTAGRLATVYALAGEDTSILLPAGSWKVVVSRGFRYEVSETTVAATPGALIDVEPTLARTIDTPSVFCADFHIHTSRSNDSPDDAPFKLRAALAEDLDIPVRSDHEYIEGWDSLITNELASSEYAIGVTSVELTGMMYFGHFGVLPLVPNENLSNNGAPRWQDYPTLGDLERPFRNRDAGEIFADVHAREERPLVIVNHPLGSSNYFGWAGYDPATGTGIDGKWSADFDAIEVFNAADWASSRSGTVAYWFSFLNRGVRVPALGSSDTHDLSDTPIGYDRTCVDFAPDSISSLPQDPAERANFGFVLRDAVAAGRVVVNGGIFVDSSVTSPSGVVRPGGTASGIGDTASVHVRVRAISAIEVDVIEVVVDGETVAQISVADDCTQNGVVRCELDIPIAVGTSNSYVVVAAHGTTPMELLLRGRYPFGMTNPIYLER